MTGPHADGLLKGLEQIAGLAVAEHTVQSMLDVVVSLAKELMPAADGAGLTLREEGRWRTTASSDNFVVEIDAKQYEAKIGPCLSAAKENLIQRSDCLATDERWPAFRDAAAVVGIRSVVAAPLSAGHAAVGALNVYAFDRRAFDAETESIATVLARHATLALASRAALGLGEDLADQLREALLSREVIGEAKGMLMERGHLTSDQAFDLLREMSQAQNRKLRTIAEEIISEVRPDPSDHE